MKSKVFTENSNYTLLQKDDQTWLAKVSEHKVELVKQMGGKHQHYAIANKFIAYFDNQRIVIEGIGVGIIKKKKIKGINILLFLREIAIKMLLNFKYKKIFKKKLRETVIRLNEEKNPPFYTENDKDVIEDVKFDIKREREKEDYRYSIGIWAKSYTQCHSIIVYKNRYIFIGSHGNNLFYVYDYELNSIIKPDLKALRLSKKKTADGFVFLKDKIIVVDNLITPKYLLLFDWVIGGIPAFSKSFEIPTHGPYESVTAYAQNDILCGLITRSGGRGGHGYHITVFDLSNLERYFSLSVYFRRMAPDSNEFEFRAIKFWRDYLLIACGAKGLGIFSIFDSDFTSTQERDNPLGLEKLFDLLSNNISVQLK
jgi:hypothetical protein